MELNLTAYLLLIATLILGASLVALGMVIGYWAGRNSLERPFRSTANPKLLRLEPLKTATGEPDGGDLYQEATFGEDRKPVSTINLEV
jgi:hypothetical protein